VYWPVVQVFILSVFQWSLVSPNRAFVGLGNFADLLSDPGFYKLLYHSVLYVAIALMGNFLLPVGLAVLTLRVSERHADLYQALLFTPTVVATSIGALLWQFIYLPSGGLLNAALALVGLPGANWLNEPGTALPAVGAVAAWNHMGFNYLIALAGLLAVPREYLEAARVDGATGWPLVRFVLVPLLMPTVLFLALTSVLQALPNAFVPIEVLTGGGPSDASNNLLYDVYRNGFRFFQVGKASAEAVLLMALLGGAAVWQFRILDRSVTYDR
jgi:ABC-type sugar transport system permease subunit